MKKRDKEKKYTCFKLASLEVASEDPLTWAMAFLEEG
jgi:hypothetical protein